MSVAVIALDVYGTVVDPAGMVLELSKTFGARASAAAQLWREKQLEFSFRRALMQRYADFDVCTAQALRYVIGQLGAKLGEAEQGALLDAYLRLPAFPDVKTGLSALEADGHKLVALTNGTEHSVRSLLQHAGISDYFAVILSANAVQTFKPDPAVYALLKRAAIVSNEDAWLVSGNPFDVIGAKAYGLRAVWLRRASEKVFDPWEYSPDVVVATLEELSSKLAGT
jgi:2-haloacid dehalogenase